MNGLADCWTQDCFTCDPGQWSSTTKPKRSSDDLAGLGVTHTVC